jgi:hypothetical protein
MLEREREREREINNGYVSWVFSVTDSRNVCFFVFARNYYSPFSSYI